MNSTIVNMISKYCNNAQTDWCRYLSFVTYAYNTSIHETTKYIPFELVYGRQARLPIDRGLGQDVGLSLEAQELFKNVAEARRLARENIKVAQIRMKTIYDKATGTWNTRQGSLF